VLVRVVSLVVYFIFILPVYFLFLVRAGWCVVFVPNVTYLLSAIYIVNILWCNTLSFTFITHSIFIF